MLKRIRDLREDDDLTQEYVAKTILIVQDQRILKWNQVPG